MGVKSVPTNDAFNAELAETLPRVLYDSIARLNVLNPEYASQLFENAKHMPLRFICTHFFATKGAQSLTRYRYFLFGTKTINLGSLVLALIDKRYSNQHGGFELPDINTFDNQPGFRTSFVDLSTASDLQYQNDLELFENLNFKITLFHEFLHADSFRNGILDHAKGTVNSGGEHDPVYSCSQYAWRLTDQLNKDESPYGAFKDYTVASFSNGVYFKYFNQRSPKSERKPHPYRILLHTFTYSKCMTCALARVYGNTYHQATDAFSKANAAQTCSRIAPKIKMISLMRESIFVK